MAMISEPHSTVIPLRNKHSVESSLRKITREKNSNIVLPDPDTEPDPDLGHCLDPDPDPEVNVRWQNKNSNLGDRSRILAHTGIRIRILHLEPVSGIHKLKIKLENYFFVALGP